MPITDGIFQPRGELVLAETTVDMVGLYNLVTDQRAALKQTAVPAARRLAMTVIEFRAPTDVSLKDLAARLETGLERTLRYGYRSARREVETLRKQQPVVAQEIPDAGEYARLARLGLPGIRTLIRRRAQAAARRVSEAALSALSLDDDNDPDPTMVMVAAAKSLHRSVLELVGETVNLGRTAGVLEMREPPTFSMRSEQLDKRTCDPCTRLHGAIVEVGSPSYFEYLPPSGCLGGGRCRGVMVFADRVEQVRGPTDEQPKPVEDFQPIPPVRFPDRRAA